jgi:NADH dehydrogenase
MPDDDVFLVTPDEDRAVRTEGRQRIVVVGGGAGGLELARKLGVRLGKRHLVTLVDCNRTHVWKPLLHEVAAGSLDANMDEVGYRSHCYRWGIRYFYGQIEGIDRTRRELLIAPLHDVDGSVLVGRHSIQYDILVVAIGSITNDFGISGARENCVFLDDRVAADGFRNRLLNQCMRVSRAALTGVPGEHVVRIVIVGGGATGVELAAELYSAAGALRQYGLEHFDEKSLRVTLVEAGPRILPALPEKLAGAARSELENLGVRVLAGMAVTEVTADAVVTSAGERIPADLKVWAAGVRGAAVLENMDGLETNRWSQLVVTPTLQTTRDPRIFAIGDCCSCTLPGTDRAVPPRAQAAHQMADTVYFNIRRMLRGNKLRDFVYRDHGSLVSLSRFSTVGSLMGNLVGGAMAIEGRLARLAYQSLYQMHLLAIHGKLKGMALIALGQVNAIIRPRMKLH